MTSPVITSCIQKMLSGSRLLDDANIRTATRTSAPMVYAMRHLERTLVLRFGELAEMALVDRSAGSSQKIRMNVGGEFKDSKNGIGAVWECPNTTAIHRCLAALAFYASWNQVEGRELSVVDLTHKLCLLVLDER